MGKRSQKEGSTPISAQRAVCIVGSGSSVCTASILSKSDNTQIGEAKLHAEIPRFSANEEKIAHIILELPSNYGITQSGAGMYLAYPDDKVSIPSDIRVSNYDLLTEANWDNTEIEKQIGTIRAYPKIRFSAV